MSRPEPSAIRQGAGPAEIEREQVAGLAAKLSGLPHEVPGARRPKVSVAARLLIVCAWLTTMILGSLALLHFVYHDGTHLLTWLNAFTRYVYMPTYVCLLIAWWKRRKWLAVASLAVIGCHLFWLVPDFVPARWLGAPSPVFASDDHSNHSLRIFFANVRVQTTRHNDMLRELSAVNPDVIVLVELSLEWWQALRNSPLMAAYPYGNGLQPDHNSDVHILSRLPLTANMLVHVAGRTVERVDIRLGQQSLRLVGLHAPRPIEFRRDSYDEFWERAVPLIAGERRPLVVVGDFNATQYSLVYQQLQASGLRSAHEDCGRGYAVTWPNGDNLLPPIRTDQAFLSPEVGCTQIFEGIGAGSDHKPLILDIWLAEPLSLPADKGKTEIPHDAGIGTAAPLPTGAAKP